VLPVPSPAERGPARVPHQSAQSRANPTCGGSQGRGLNTTQSQQPRGVLLWRHDRSNPHLGS
jgi:hypothetical protein